MKNYNLKNLRDLITSPDFTKEKYQQLLKEDALSYDHSRYEIEYNKYLDCFNVSLTEGRVKELNKSPMLSMTDEPGISLLEYADYLDSCGLVVTERSLAEKSIEDAERGVIFMETIANVRLEDPVSKKSLFLYYDQSGTLMDAVHDDGRYRILNANERAEKSLKVISEISGIREETLKTYYGRSGIPVPEKSWQEAERLDASMKDAEKNIPSLPYWNKAYLLNFEMRRFTWN